MNITTTTPTHAWMILAILIWTGINATKELTISIPRLFIIPALLTMMKLKVFLHSGPSIMLSYTIALALSSFYSFRTKPPAKFSKDKWSVTLPGSYKTLVVLLIFFAVKYTFGFMKSNNAELYSSLIYLDMLLSGIFSGFFLGRATFFLSNIKKKKLSL